jgi:hypothetical protein
MNFGRKSENLASAFDWLNVHKESFENDQKKSLEKDYLLKQVKQLDVYQEMKTKAKYRVKQKHLLKHIFKLNILKIQKKNNKIETKSVGKGTKESFTKR